MTIHRISASPQLPVILMVVEEAEEDRRHGDTMGRRKKGAFLRLLLLPFTFPIARFILGVANERRRRRSGNHERTKMWTSARMTLTTGKMT